MIRLAVILFGLSSVVFAVPKYKTMAKVVTTAGTRVALSATELSTSDVCLKANAANTGLVYVGGVDVAAANGYPLAASQEVCLGDLEGGGSNAFINLAHVYLDSAVNGEGVRVLYVTGR